MIHFEADFQPSGKWRDYLRAKEGGVYRGIVPLERLVSTLAPFISSHRSGWNSAFDRLGDYRETRPS